MSESYLCLVVAISSMISFVTLRKDFMFISDLFITTGSDFFSASQVIAFFVFDRCAVSGSECDL